MFHHDLSGVRTQLHDLFFEGVANAEARVIGQFAQIFDLTGKFMLDDRFWQRPGAVVALVERDIVVTDADIADAA